MNGYSLHVAAQRTDSSRRPVVLKTNLWEPFNILTFPTALAAVEIGLSKSVSLQIGAGYRLYRLGPYEDSIFVQPTGFKTQLQFRNYKWLSPKTLSTRPQLDGGYVGLDLFYNYERFNALQKYGVPPDSILFESYDGFGVIRRKYGGNVILGYQWRISSRWATDFYSGLGIAYKDVRNISREIDFARGDLLDLYRHDIFQAAESKLRESSGVKANFTFNLSVGYAIIR